MIFMKKLFAVVALAVLVASCSLGTSVNTVSFKDNGSALVNPGMGFIEYTYAGRLWAYGSTTPSWDALDWFPGCSTVYMRLLWSELEPREGEYRWDILDRYSQAWAAAGKKLAFRIICCNQTKNACPDFVREAGAKGSWFRYGKHEVSTDFPERWEPEYDDPVFLEKFGAFLKAFAKRYDGDPNVAFVDVGSYGLYGEGHREFSDAEIADDPGKNERLAKLHLDLWREAMPNTYLIVSDDIGGSKNLDPDHPLLAYAREIGIGFRDDSIFCYAERPWYHDGWSRKFAETSPVVIESGHLRFVEREGKIDTTFTETKLLKCIEDHQASYFSIHDFPKDHLKRFRPVIEKMNLRLGYRLVPEEISYPTTVRIDEPVEIESIWKNAGVAPCYGGGHIAWMLLDGKGNVCWNSVDEGFDVRALEPTIGGVEKPLKVKSRVTFGFTDINPNPDNCLTWARETGYDPGEKYEMLAPGNYLLCFAIGSRIGVPSIAVPVKGDKQRRIYPVGKIKVVR